MNPLTIPKADLGRGARIPLTVLRGNAEVVARFADDVLGEYRAALAAGRPHAVFIVPVGPVGHYDLLADRCNAERLSLRPLVRINMDEYLTADGLDWIPAGDPSRRGEGRIGDGNHVDRDQNDEEAQGHRAEPDQPTRTTFSALIRVHARSPRPCARLSALRWRRPPGSRGRAGR